ncbi:MAG: hypothetical protein ACREXV_01730 [Polaromonas sp.]
MQALQNINVPALLDSVVSLTAAPVIVVPVPRCHYGHRHWR